MRLVSIPEFGIANSLKLAGFQKIPVQLFPNQRFKAHLLKHQDEKV